MLFKVIINVVFDKQNKHIEFGQVMLSVNNNPTHTIFWIV